MIQDVVEMCTALYCLVDNLYQPLARQHDHRPGPRPACSDSEVISLSRRTERIGLDEEVRFLASMRQHGTSLFPVLPARSRYTRRRRALQRVTGHIRTAEVRLLDHVQGLDHLCVIDGVHSAHE